MSTFVCIAYIFKTLFYGWAKFWFSKQETCEKELKVAYYLFRSSGDLI